MGCHQTNGNANASSLDLKILQEKREERNGIGIERAISAFRGLKFLLNKTPNVPKPPTLFPPMSSEKKQLQLIE